MLMFLIAELSRLGFKYHDKKSNKFKNDSKEYAFHVYMMGLYKDVLGLALDSDRLRKKYLN